MAQWKMPPKAKVYEALSAVGDGRVFLKNNLSAEVTSSDGSKSYLVEWSEDFKKITSNDNASYWQGYLGYPIIAVLLISNKIEYNPEVAKLMVGVNWKKINTDFKRDYNKAIEYVLKNVEEKVGYYPNIINQEVDKIMLQIEKFSFHKMQQKMAPPKGN